MTEETYHEEIIGGEIVMVKDKHEHQWQLHQTGFGADYVTFYCHCGCFKEVKKKKLKRF